jgi:hypothetical protein
VLHGPTARYSPKCPRALHQDAAPASHDDRLLDRHVLAFNVAGFLQAAADRPHDVCECVGRCIVQEAHDGHSRLLRARRERPGCRATKRGYEFSPSDVDGHVTLPWGSCA